MKLQRTTLVLLFTAILLGGLVYFAEIQGASKREAVKITKQPIFALKEDEIQSLTLYLDEETLEFERVSGKIGWQMKTPKDIPASNAAVAFLLNLLVEGKSDRSFPIKPNQFQDYGLDKPIAVVSVKLKNQQTHQLILGKPDFNRSFLYAQADPSVKSPQPSWKVLLVPIDFEYAVNRPLSEWQSKSENIDVPTPSPTTATPKPSPTPSPAAATPKPSPTPSPAVATPKPSPAAATPKPSPTPSPTTATPKPSPAAATPKPSPTLASPTPSPASGR